MRRPTLKPAQTLLVTLLGAIFIVACSEGPLVERDDEGPRIASLSPALAQMLRDTGGGNALVARDAYDTWSDPALPVIGDLTGIDYEALLVTQPTHVLMEPSGAGLPTRLVSLAASSGWELVVLPTLSLEDVRASASVLADRFGAADDLETWQRAWDGVSTPIANLAGERPLVLLATDPPAALGPGSVHHELVSLLGATAIPESGAAYQRLSLEDVIALDPTSFVLLAPGESSTDLDALLGPMTRLDLRAVRDRRVVVVRDPMALIPSTSLIATLHELRGGLRALVSGG